jgi:hypothetical protein
MQRSLNDVARGLDWLRQSLETRAGRAGRLVAVTIHALVDGA